MLTTDVHSYVGATCAGSCEADELQLQTWIWETGNTSALMQKDSGAVTVRHGALPTSLAKLGLKAAMASCLP